jgi:type VI secretion system secreted protein Hcp
VDSRHPAWIEVDSFTWGVSPSADAATNRAGSRPAPRSLVVRKVVDRASPPLYQACAAGRKLARAVLAVREPDSAVDDLVIELHDVLVSAVHLDGDAAAFPMEEISLDYGRITWTYRQSDGSGGPPTEITASWDVAGASTPPRTAAVAPRR